MSSPVHVSKMVRGETPAAASPGMSLRDIRIYLNADGRPPAYAEQLLQAHGVPLAADAPAHIVPVDACWRIFVEHAAVIGDEMHCVSANRLKPGSTGLLIARMMLCPTILEAMNAYSETAALITPDVAVSVTRKPNGVALRWRPSAPGSELHQIMLEGTAAVYFAVFSWLAGKPLSVVRVRAPAARKDAGSTLLHILGAPIAYAGDELEITFAPESAEATVMERDVNAWLDGAYKMLCTAAIGVSAGKPEGAFTERVRAALLQGVDQQEVALRCGMSTKTVARRLEQEGRSFRRVRDEVRMQKSTSLIHAALTVETIAEQLGYGDTRSFRRAFKRWFGVSPSTYRSQRACAN